MESSDKFGLPTSTVRQGRIEPVRRAAESRDRLGRSSLRFADRFKAASDACSSPSGLHRLLTTATQELGFDYFALLHHSSLRKARPFLVRYDNYPHEWVKRFNRDPAFRPDPVQRASQLTNVGFCWEELPGLIALSLEQQWILEEGARFGIGQGFTVPANIPGEPGASCSFVVRPTVPMPRDRLLLAELVAAHAFKAARRLSGKSEARARPHLSRRQLECVRLVAAGKTDWEIAAILGLAEETVRFYVKQARAAYDVVSRAQLIVRSLRDAYISFDDAIPPSG